MLTIVNEKNEDFLLENMEEVDLLSNLRYRKLIGVLGIFVTVSILASPRLSFQQVGIVLLIVMLGLVYLALHQTFRLPCKVIRRKTGYTGKGHRNKFYINVQTEDGSIWMARVSRAEYVKAKEGTKGYIYFTGKDIEKDKSVLFDRKKIA